MFSKIHVNKNVKSFAIKNQLHVLHSKYPRQLDNTQVPTRMKIFMITLKLENIAQGHEA